MTLNGVIVSSLRYLTEFGSFQGALRKSGWRYTDTFCGRNEAPQNVVLTLYHLWRYSQGITPSESVKVRHSLSLAKI